MNKRLLHTAIGQHGRTGDPDSVLVRAQYQRLHAIDDLLGRHVLRLVGQHVGCSDIVDPLLKHDPAYAWLVQRIAPESRQRAGADKRLGGIPDNPVASNACIDHRHR
jgi:hypothetical protein